MIASRASAVRRALHAVLAASLYLLAFAPMLAFAHGETSRDVPAPGALRATLDRHLAAINARDLDTLLSTVTQGDKLTTILPNGKVLLTREDYRSLHVDWFADRDWRMVFDVQDVQSFGDVGIARVRYDSQAKADDGAYASKRIALLTLVFARERGAWRLVYDQNTVIPPATN